MVRDYLLDLGQERKHSWGNVGKYVLHHLGNAFSEDGGFFLGGWWFQRYLIFTSSGRILFKCYIEYIYIYYYKKMYICKCNIKHIYTYRPKSSGLEKRNSKTKTCVSQFCVSRLILQGCIHTYSHQTDSRQQPGREEWDRVSSSALVIF